MPKEIHHICDRCGTDYGEDPDGKCWTIEVINYRDSQFRPSQYSPDNWADQKALWCASCIEVLTGREPGVMKRDDPAPPSIEDLVREIVREEVEDGR